MADFSPHDRAITAVTAFSEASSGTPFDRECVIHTIFNRWRSVGKWFRQPTLAGVCTLRAQYSEYNGDAVNNKNLLRGMNTSLADPIMTECYALFDKVAAGSFDPTEGATHYHDKSIPDPPWADPATGAKLSLETGKFRFFVGVK